MVNYLELPIGDKSPEVFRAIIEIPYEGINKYLNHLSDQQKEDYPSPLALQSLHK